MDLCVQLKLSFQVIRFVVVGRPTENPEIQKLCVNLERFETRTAVLPLASTAALSKAKAPECFSPPLKGADLTTSNILNALSTLIYTARVDLGGAEFKSLSPPFPPRPREEHFTHAFFVLFGRLLRLDIEPKALANSFECIKKIVLPPPSLPGRPHLLSFLDPQPQLVITSNTPLNQEINICTSLQGACFHVWRTDFL